MRLVGELREPPPAGLEGARGRARHGCPRRRFPVTPQPSEPFATRSSSAGRQAECLAELTDRRLGPERRIHPDQRDTIRPELLRQSRQQPVANIARQIDVDIGQSGQLLVEEPPDRKLSRRSGRYATAPPDNKRSEETDDPRPRPGSNNALTVSGPRTSIATSRASCRTS